MSVQDKSVEVRAIRPITPGQRGKTVVVDRRVVHHSDTNAPRSLVKSKAGKGSARNNHGRKTVNHRGGGHSHHDIQVDFKRNQHDDVKAKVTDLVYDANRSAHLALLSYSNGAWGYIIAPKGISAGDEIVSGPSSPIKPGNSMPLSSIPVGTMIHCVELKPGAGAQLVRSAGNSALIIASEAKYVILRLRSGEVRKVLNTCRATIGEVGFSQHALKKLGKAGVKRWLGIRPTVRGVAMNPVDHPMGGGEGRTSGGRPSVDRKGRRTKGEVTRKRNKPSNRLIVRSVRRAKQSKRG
jgi:large subunit ribosomal protein L2